jgi:muconate cycloisomerase
MPSVPWKTCCAAASFKWNVFQPEADYFARTLPVSDQLTIRAVEAIPVRVTGSRDFRISEGQTRIHTSTILRVLTEDEGIEGIAEVVCAPPGKPEELPQEILAAVRDFVTPALVGVAVTDRNRACARLEASLKERPWTKAAVNVALHDLQAKSLGVPVTDLLGGRVHERIPIIGPVVGINSPQEMARLAAAEVAEGFRAVKIKVGETVAGDIERVAAVREAMGATAALRVDANDHYQAADAIRLIRAIERYDIEHVEQPVARRDVLGMQAVKNAVGVPLMTDDMVATPQEAMNVIRLGAADHMKVKVTKHGLDGARQIIEMLAAARGRGPARRLRGEPRTASRDRFHETAGHGHRHPRRGPVARGRFHQPSFGTRPRRTVGRRDGGQTSHSRLRSVCAALPESDASRRRLFDQEQPTANDNQRTANDSH